MVNNKISKRKPRKLRSIFRIYILVAFIMVAVTLILLRLYNLQVSAHEYYEGLASNQHKALDDLIPKRGSIYVKDSQEPYPVAINKELNLLYAVPREVEDPDYVARTLSVILNLNEQELRDKLDQPDGWYAVLAHKIDDSKVDEIKTHNFSGIYNTPEIERSYPAGNFASQLIGFVGSDGTDEKGRYGLEAYWEEELSGKAGQLEQEKDTRGRWISIGERSIIPAQDGADLMLTIDHTIQYRAEMAIRKAVERFEADSGTIVVIDPPTGAIISMASWPSFDPNSFSSVEDISVFSNPAVSDSYECGSIFKPITMSAALDSGALTPDTTYVDTGQVNEAGYTIKNSDLKSNGIQTMTQVLEKSLNTGAIFAEKSVGNLRFYEYVKNYGFGEKTGIGTIGESPGNISGLRALKDINAFTASFGQGISMTPLQLASAFATIANSGKLMKPYIVDRMLHQSGEEKIIEPQEIRRVISKDASLDLTKMLVSVVQNGHGKKAGVPGYLVAGKTGTAQIPRTDGPGYEEGAHIGSFAGYAPAYDPKFAMLVRINKPRNVEWAESSAAPTFGEMAEFMLDYFGVEPTEPYTEKDVELFNATHDISIFQAPKAEEKPEEPQKPEEDKKEKKKKKH